LPEKKVEENLSFGPPKKKPPQLPEDVRQSEDSVFSTTTNNQPDNSKKDGTLSPPKKKPPQFPENNLQQPQNRNRSQTESVLNEHVQQLLNKDYEFNAELVTQRSNPEFSIDSKEEIDSAIKFLQDLDQTPSYISDTPKGLSIRSSKIDFMADMKKSIGQRGGNTKHKKIIVSRKSSNSNNE